MKLSLKNPFVLMLLCLMAGMFMTVSFLETPMKFQVEGINLPVALGLGKLMFGLSTKIQGVFLMLVLVLMLISHRNYSKFDFIVLLGLFFILSLEQFRMLPVLNARVDALSSGKVLPATSLHDYFIYAETAKAGFLILMMILQFKKASLNNQKSL